MNGSGGEKHQVALEKLISAVTNPQVLTYSNFSKNFIVYVDASKNGFGSAPYQQQQEQLRVIGYGSRTLAGAENVTRFPNWST